MRMSFRIVMLLTVAGAALLSGCSKKKTKDGMAGDGTTIFPEPIGDGEFSFVADSMPFDQNRERISDTTLTPVYFGYDSFQLAPAEVTKIERAADYLTGNARAVVIVEGHCDERGSNEYNLSLGEQRAQSVRSYLINLGIATERIQTRSYGEEHPAAQGSGESVWSLNRRCEFALFK